MRGELMQGHWGPWLKIDGQCIHRRDVEQIEPQRRVPAPNELFLAAGMGHGPVVGQARHGFTLSRRIVRIKDGV